MEYLIELPDNLTYETIYGQIVSKANSYQAVPDKQGGETYNQEHTDTQVREIIYQAMQYLQEQANQQAVCIGGAYLREQTNI